MDRDTQLILLFAAGVLVGRLILWPLVYIAWLELRYKWESRRLTSPSEDSWLDDLRNWLDGYRKWKGK